MTTFHAKPRFRSPEQIAADRDAILALCDGTRSAAEIARDVGRNNVDVHADVKALRRCGHPAPLRNPSMISRDAAVYRHFDAEGRLLYIGCTSDLLRRTLAHERRSHWFDQIAVIKVERFKSVEDAVAAETRAILAERPIHNVHGNTARTGKDALTRFGQIETGAAT